MKLSSIATDLVKLTAITIVALMLGCIPWAYAVTPLEFGGKGDVVTLRDGVIGAGGASFRSYSATFTSADVGKAIVVTDAGIGGGALIAKIQALVSVHEVTLTTSAGTSVNNALTYYGTDDTAAIRSCVYKGTTKGGVCNISDGVTFMVSNTSSMIAPFGAGNNPIQRGTINGHGKIIFAPQGKLVGNDRLFYISSQETYPMKIAPGAIAMGATSFTAQDSSDAAKLSPGDWVIITERDSTVKDHVYADWMEVARVDGAVVHTAKPFRMAFPNARPWGGPPTFWGLSFRKVGPITSNVEVHDITIIIPKVKDTHVIVGIATRDTRGALIDHITCQDASGNCFAGYMDQGLTIQNSSLNESVYTEVAAAVDTVISGNHVNENTSALLLTGPPTSGGLEVDFGTGFSRVTDNIIGASRQVCINVSPGVHDTLVKGNACGLVTFGSGASCIFSRGGYRLTITDNTCMGGTTGAARGIDVADAPNLTAPMYSEGNRIASNKVRGFAKPYACEGRLRRDACDQH
jgi:hypothetical protein